MHTNLNNIIKYYGNQSYEKSNLVDFNQFYTSSTFSIPSINNNIHEISKVWVDISDTSSERIRTPIGSSCEGQILSGNKILICGTLDIKMEYISSNEVKTIESVYLNIPISTSVTLEDDIDEYQTEYPSIIIEDIYCKKLDLKTFYLNVMLIAIVDVF